MKKVLIFGAGMVAKPMIDYLLDAQNFHVVNATRTVAKAEKIMQNRKNTSIVQFVMGNDDKLDQLVSSADAVVSLLPYTHHLKVAEYCLKYRKPLITTSYVSKQMQNLDSQANERGILILNEIGLDPGIDHMSAMRIIDNVQERQGKINAFRSYCGGFPAPEANNNPWGYKFSWSPRGVLMAGRNSAKYLKSGEVIEIDGKELFKNHWPIEIGDFKLETYPNRDSMPYIKLYGISDTKTMYRGTLRYPGWCRTMLAVAELGLLKEDELKIIANMTNKQILQNILGLSTDQDPKLHIAGLLKIEQNDEILKKLEWLNIFSDDIFQKESLTPIDFLSDLMMKRMKYKAQERDAIVLHHDFEAEFPDKKEKITSTLIDYGIISGDSAMSRTVSLPAAIAVKLILDGQIKETGVRIPVDEEIYIPVLDELERLGIVCQEKIEVMNTEDN